VQHNPQNKKRKDDGRKQNETNASSQFDMRNVYPKEMYVQDVGRGTDDPDNVRRQKQDYFDNWELTAQSPGVAARRLVDTTY